MSTDVVVVEMLRSNLQGLIEEMEHLLTRSAYSTIMRESRDCSFLVLDPSGRVVVTQKTMIHAPTYRALVQAVLSRYGADGLQEGDVILSNHPYAAGLPHTPDLGLVVPVFVNKKLAGFSCSIAHKPDFGGAVPGSASSKSTELFQEGLLLPVIKLYEGGRYREDIEQIIVANVRYPDLVLGDMRAQVGVTRIGAERYARLLHRYGTQSALAAFEQMLALSERRLRAQLQAWPDGTFSAEGFLDSDGVRVDRPVRFHVAVTVKGDSVHFDFSASDDQTRGPVNLRPPYAEMCTFYALLCVADPSLPFNDGLRRAVTFDFREGSVLNPRLPAPVSAATVSSYRLMDIVLEALGHFDPARTIAHSGGSGGAMSIAWQGGAAEGRSSFQYEIFGTAMGGRNGRDGVSAVGVYSTNIGIAPIEIMETQYPLRVRRFELIRDSAGAGRFRGGLSYRRDYELLQPAAVHRRADRMRFPANGVAGGKPGRAGALVLDPGTDREQQLPVSGEYSLPAGTILRIEGAGAGGFGDPRERDPEAVARDVRSGYVSPEAALENYGVVVD